MVAGIFFSCQNSIEEIDSATGDSELPSRTIYMGSFDYTEKGKIHQRISAGEMNQYENENLEASHGVKVEMFDENEEIEAILTSKSGTYNQAENILIARDSVRLRNAIGDVLMTEELILYQDSNLIKTEVPIEIHKGDNVIFGEGLEADANFSKYQIKNPGGSRIMIPDQDSLEQK